MDMRKASMFQLAIDARHRGDDDGSGGGGGGSHGGSMPLGARREGRRASQFSLGSATMQPIHRKVFQFLEHRELGRVARVCKRWKGVAYDARLWQEVSLRPDSGLHIPNIEFLVYLIRARFGSSLHYLELPIDLITAPVLHELTNSCPALRHLVLDFSNAMQLHDFQDLSSFPPHLRTLCICLSDVIFMEGFMRQIYKFVNSLEVLQLVGTYEQVSEEQEEVYEVLNIHKLKSFTPNLKVINFYGVKFVDDTHIEAISSTCVHLSCLCIKFCVKFQGSSLKLLLGRCRRLRSLLMEQTGLREEHLEAVEWEKTSVSELDLTSCEIGTACLLNVLPRIPMLTWLACGHMDGFNNQVMERLLKDGKLKSLQSLDLQFSDNLSEDVLIRFFRQHGHQLRGVDMSGMPALGEPFWTTVLPQLRRVRILIMGNPNWACLVGRPSVKIHVDQVIDCAAHNCARVERLEVKWDTDSLRFSDKSSKFIDTLRSKCLRLRSLTLADGEYYELVRSNFERAERRSVVRTTTLSITSTLPLLTYYNDLRFN